MARHFTPEAARRQTPTTPAHTRSKSHITMGNRVAQPPITESPVSTPLVSFQLTRTILSRSTTVICDRLRCTSISAQPEGIPALLPECGSHPERSAPTTGAKRPGSRRARYLIPVTADIICSRAPSAFRTVYRTLFRTPYVGALIRRCGHRKIDGWRIIYAGAPRGPGGRARWPGKLVLSSTRVRRRRRA